MKIKFNSVITHSQNEPYTQQQFEEWKALLQETDARKVLKENELLEIMAIILGEDCIRLMTLANHVEFIPTIQSKLEKYKSLIDSASIEVNGFSVNMDTLQDYENRRHDYFQYGRSYVELDFELTISGLTLSDIEIISRNSGCYSINNGLGFISEVQTPAALTKNGQI